MGFTRAVYSQVQLCTPLYVGSVFLHGHLLVTVILAPASPFTSTSWIGTRLTAMFHGLRSANLCSLLLPLFGPVSPGTPMAPPPLPDDDDVVPHCDLPLPTPKDDLVLVGRPVLSAARPPLRARSSGDLVSLPPLRAASPTCPLARPAINVLLM